MKLPNKGDFPAEAVEGRGVAKGNADKTSASRTQSRTSCASTGLESVREVARRDRRVRFTALLHHITPSLLVESSDPAFVGMSAAPYGMACERHYTLAVATSGRQSEPRRSSGSILLLHGADAVATAGAKARSVARSREPRIRYARRANS